MLGIIYAKNPITRAVLNASEKGMGNLQNEEERNSKATAQHANREQQHTGVGTNKKKTIKRTVRDRKELNRKGSKTKNTEQINGK